MRDNQVIASYEEWFELLVPFRCVGMTLNTILILVLFKTIQRVNSLWPSDTICWRPGCTLSQTIACRLYGVKPLLEPKVAYKMIMQRALISTFSGWENENQKLSFLETEKAQLFEMLPRWRKVRFKWPDRYNGCWCGPRGARAWMTIEETYLSRNIRASELGGLKPDG